jgi:hypothetical protein
MLLFVQSYASDRSEAFLFLHRHTFTINNSGASFPRRSLAEQLSPLECAVPSTLDLAPFW